MKRSRSLIATQITLCAVVANLAVCCVSKAADTETKARILQFPEDRSLGALSVRDANIQRKIESFFYWIDGAEWKYLGEARGAVTVPANQRLQLVLHKATGNELSALARLGPDDLYELHMSRNADNQALVPVAALTGLKALHFPRAFDDKEKLPIFTPQSLKQLGTLKSLERLTIPDQLTDAGLAALAEALPQVRALYFNRNKLTDRGLAVLSKFTALEELNIGGVQVTSRGLAVLADLPSLRYLSFWGRGLNDDALLQIRKITSLKTLSVPTWITDAGLAHLAGHPSLENLNLYDTKVTDRGLVHLTTMPLLKMLDLGKRDYDRKNPPITDAGTVHLKANKSLEYLHLMSAGLSDAGLANLAELRNLKQLEFQMPFSSDPKKHPGPSRFTEKGVKDLTRIRSLESLCLLGPAVTDDALVDIAQMTNLRSLSLSGCPISDEGIAKLTSLRALETLTMRYPSQVTASGLNRLNALSRLCSLQVDLTTPDVPDGQPLKLSNLTRLENLTLQADRGSSFRDADLVCLASLKRLKRLQLGVDLAITDAGMTNLAGLTTLETLGIGGAELTDRSLAALTNLSRLNQLYISGGFTDAGVQQLERLQALNRVTIISAGNISAAAKDRLHRNLPNLNHLSADQNRSMKRPGKTAGPPKPGTPAPDFTVTTLDGAKFTLSEMRGKVVMLHFWATWCGPCVKNSAALARYQDQLKQKYGDRVVLLDLALDDSDSKLRSFVATHKLTTPQARIGLQSKPAADYGVEGVPDDFMIGPDGRILLSRESPEGSGDTETVIDRALGVNSSTRAGK